VDDDIGIVREAFLTAVDGHRAGETIATLGVGQYNRKIEIDFEKQVTRMPPTLQPFALSRYVSYDRRIGSSDCRSERRKCPEGLKTHH
jgi:hypothetical protein